MTDTRNTTPPDVRQSSTIYINTDTSKDAFIRALHNAEKGDRIVYHIGQHCGGLHRRDAAKAGEDGKALLFCKRSYGGTFEYLAVKK